jgi:hypothetical protein
MSYFEDILASQDRRFQAALAQALPLYHAGARGGQFEEDVRAIIREFLPVTYRVRGALMAPSGGIRKQLDLAVCSASIPPLFQQLPIERITVAGEVKTVLGSRARDDIVSTAGKLADAAAGSNREDPLPFVIIAGSLGVTNHARWLAELVGSVADAPHPCPIWPAAFSFDETGPMAAISVHRSSLLQARTTTGDILDGVITMPRNQLSPSALCYLWIWAAICATDPTQRMEYHYMREVIHSLDSKADGLEVLFLAARDSGAMLPKQVYLVLPEAQASLHRASGTGPVPTCGKVSASKTIDGNPKKLHDQQRFMLIKLGPWVDDEETWDESPWGGSPVATRRGYGYYDEMPRDELLESCRLFWKFNPESDTWRGIEHAVVAHAGVTRAVVSIDEFIGPFWGRFGFRGHVVDDPAAVDRLVGREVPSRQNPITTIEL